MRIPERSHNAAAGGLYRRRRDFFDKEGNITNECTRKFLKGFIEASLSGSRFSSPVESHHVPSPARRRRIKSSGKVVNSYLQWKRPSNSTATIDSSERSALKILTDGRRVNQGRILAVPRTQNPTITRILLSAAVSPGSTPRAVWRSCLLAGATSRSSWSVATTSY